MQLYWHQCFIVVFFIMIDHAVKIVDLPTFCNNALVACDLYVFVILNYKLK